MEENNLPLQTDTRAFTAFAGNTADMYRPENNNLYTPEPTLTRIDDGPVKELSNFVAGIKFDTSMNAMDLFSNKNSDWRTAIDPTYGKVGATTSVPLTETHTQMSDGETWMPKYKNYMAGVDNDSRLAMQQTDSEKFWNPAKRFLQNTSLGVADLAAGVYGLIGAAFTGKLDTIYDNDFAQSIDNMTERNNLQFKNYYTEAQRNQSLGLNNQTWDKFLGGAEFTARMLVGEAALAVATSGTSLLGSGTSLVSKLTKGAAVADKASDIAVQGSRISKIMSKIMAPELRAASKGAHTPSNLNIFGAADNILSQSQSINNKAKVLKNLNKARFALMSPLYEAGFEARHARKEMEEDFYDYYRQLGRNPNTDEINKFSEKMNNASETVFAMNMGILAPSNLATLGGIVGVQTPLSRFVTSSGKAFNKNILKIGIETGEDGIKRAVKYNAGHRVLGTVIPTAKGMFIEGVFEEGSQGIISNTVKNYVASSYDPKAMAQTADYIDAFGKAYRDQFGTKEGQEEIIIGALIGGIMGGFGGAISNRNERRAQSTIAAVENEGDAFNASLRTDGYRSAWLQELIKHSNRESIINDRIEESETNGDYLGVAKGKHERFISLLQAYKSVGRDADFVKMISETVKGFDAASMSESSGVPLDNIEQYKASSIEQLQKTADMYSTIYDASMEVFKKNPFGANSEITTSDGSKRKATAHDYAAGLAYSATMSDFNRNIAKDAYNLFLNKLASNVSDKSLIAELGALGAIMTAGKVELDSYKKVLQDLNNSQDKLNKLREKITKASTTEEGKTIAVEKLLKEHTEYQLLSNQLSDLNHRKEALWSTMTANFYESMDQKEFGTSMDLNNFTNRTQQMEEALSKLPASEQQGLEGILRVFNTANNDFRSFSNLYEQLSDPTVKFKGANNGALLFPVGKFIAKTQNKITPDKVKQAYNLMVKANGMSIYGIKSKIGEPKTVITEEVFNSEEAPSTSILDYMKSKINRDEDFSQYEQKYYEKHKSLIDDHVIEEVKSTEPMDEEPPLITEIARRNSAAKILSDFRKGIYTDEQADKIKEFDEVNDRLEKSIQDLKAKLSEIKEEPVGESHDKEIFEIEAEIETLERKSKQNLKNLGYEVREDGVYHYGEKISDETSTDIIEEDVNQYKEDFDKRVKTLDRSKYNLFYYVKNGNVISGNLEDLSVNESLPESLRKAIREAIDTNSSVIVPNNVSFGEVTEDDIKVTDDSVIVKYLDEDGKEYTEEYFALNKEGKYGTFSDSFVFGTKDGVTFAKDGSITEVENEDGVMERSIAVKYLKPGGKNRTNFSLGGIILDKIIFETVYNEFNKRATNEQRARLEEHIDNRVEIGEQTEKLANARENRAADIRAENKRVKDAKKDILEKEIAPLELEQARNSEELNTYLSEQEKILQDNVDAIKTNVERYRKLDRLRNNIKKLRSKLQSSEFAKESSQFTEEELERMNPITEDAKQYYADLKKLLNYQKQLIAMENSNEIKPFRNDMTNSEKIEWVYNNIEGVEVATIDEAMNLTPPKSEELREYYRLNRKRKRTSEENQDLERLRDKIFQFELVSHIPGMSLQELVTIAQQQLSAVEMAANEKGTSLETLEQGVEITSNSSDLNKKRDEINPSVSNINDFALFGISKDREKIGDTYVEGEVAHTLHNKKPQPFIETLMKSGWKGYVTITDFNMEPIHTGLLDSSNYFMYGNLMDSNPAARSEFGKMERISILFEKDGQTFTMSRNKSRRVHNSKVNINKDGFETFLEAVNIKSFKQKGINNNYTMIYEEKSNGIFAPMESDKLIDMVNEAGEVEYLAFDSVEANSLRPGDTIEVVFEPNDGLNIVLSKNSKFDPAKDGRFHIYSNGKLVGLLKGPSDEEMNGKKSSSSWNRLINFRQAVIANGGRLETSVNNSFINFPLYQFDSEMNPLSTPIREDKVITYGYVKDGVITTLDEKYNGIEVDINFAGGDFLPKDGKSRPIAIFKTSGKTAAFPINLTMTGENEDISPVIREIFDSSITHTEKVIAINNELARIGMNSSENLMTENTKNIDHILAALEDYKDKVDVTNSDYYKGATSYIDFNNPFSGAKLHVSTAFAKPSTESLPETVDINENLKEDTDEAINNNVC